MLLNKKDLLRAKVLEGRYKIESYFPEYSTYQMTSDSKSEIAKASAKGDKGGIVLSFSL